MARSPVEASMRVVEDPLDTAALVAGVRTDADGALALFVGVVRDHNDGKRVRFLEYHAYPEMADAEMARIEAEARERFGVGEVRSMHRIGRLGIGDASVAVAVAAPHRADAFEACRYVIDRIKETVPIWKLEHFEGGADWIEGRSRVPRRPPTG